MGNLLFEIGTEEIPAGFVEPTLQQLQQKFEDKTKELKIGHGDIKCLGTPRRLALVVTDLAETQEEIKEELLGPSKKAGVDADGNFTKAAEGFARSKGADTNALQVVDTPKGEYLMLVRESGGEETKTLLPTLLKEILLSLTFPKSMRWGSNSHSFARPIQWLVALLDDDVLNIEHEGIRSSRETGGHRFLANERFPIQSPLTYEAELRKKYVVADIESRKKMVVEEIQRSVRENATLTNAEVLVDEGLVDTVSHLVEFPCGVCGRFDDKFLQLPDEVLITSMREHQKYFPVVDSEGKLMSAFVAVNNTRVNDLEITTRGHQRVLRARLEDALFFFNKDRETPLSDNIPRLEGIIFQAKLGTMLEKKNRLVKLSKLLCEMLTPELAPVLERAAQLCKADLLTDMVGEFPSLQGVMGAAYAQNDGEDPAVAQAILEHYMPKRSGAALPQSDAGAILGLADRFDTLVGCFGIGQVPSGNADPFGLRRISLGILHILAEKKYTISLREVIHKALALYGDKVDGSSATVDQIVLFLKGRFVNDCVREGLPSEVVEAGISVNFDEINDCRKRIDAINDVRMDPDFPVLAGSYKRIRNIIKDNTDTSVDEGVLAEQSEKTLYQLCVKVQAESVEYIGRQEYKEALKAMLQMKQPVDNFFEEVMVMAEDKAVRQNRLNLLTALGNIILKVGDISKIQEG